MQKQLNLTGIPDKMKEWFENLSGYSFDDVKVYYNSELPERLGVPAYTRAGCVYLAPKCEYCLEHELVHVIQQKQGRVKRAEGYCEINFDEELEQEADSIYVFTGE